MLHKSAIPMVPARRALSMLRAARRLASRAAPRYRPPTVLAQRRTLCTDTPQQLFFASSSRIEDDDEEIVASLRLQRFRPIYERLAMMAGDDGNDGDVSLRDLSEGIRAALPEATITDEQVERMFRIGDLDNNGSSTTAAQTPRE